jgi:hypothetical protein
MRINLNEWSQVRGRPYAVYLSPSGEVVVLGVPRDKDGNEDESHNCDANGCGQDHVLWRGKTVTGEIK